MQCVNLVSQLAHPGGHTLACALLKGQTEGAVAAEAAFAGQLLGDDGLSSSGDLLIAADEMVDAQIVDIDIVSDALTGEILAEIRAVGANFLGQLLKGQIVLQVELRVHAVLVQQSFDLIEVNSGRSLLLGRGLG